MNDISNARRTGPRSPRQSSAERPPADCTKSAGYLPWTGESEPPTGRIRLLGGFDPYTLSLQKEAEPLLPIARRPLVSRTAGWISAVVLDGGRVIGTWSHEAKPAGVSVRVEPWRRLTKADRRQVEDEAARIAAFLVPGATAGVTYAAAT